MIFCDIHACVGCRMCEVACSTRHFGAVSPAMARIRVAKLEESGIDLAITCVSCVEKFCLTCPSDALVTGARGEIRVDPESCNACLTCVEACPIGAAGFYGGQPLFCDLCGGEPACVIACPTAALSCRDDYLDTPLRAFSGFRGSSSQKRARFAQAQGEPVRSGWKEGRRIDS